MVVILALWTEIVAGGSDIPLKDAGRRQHRAFPLWGGNCELHT